jgi:hypothetical protein
MITEIPTFTIKGCFFIIQVLYFEGYPAQLKMTIRRMPPCGLAWQAKFAPHRLSLGYRSARRLFSNLRILGYFLSNTRLVGINIARFEGGGRGPIQPELKVQHGVGNRARLRCIQRCACIQRTETVLISLAFKSPGR